MDFTVAVPVLAVTVNGTTYRYSDVPFSNATFTAQAKVLSFGSLKRAASGRKGQLPPIEFEVQIADQDGSIRALAAANSIKGSAVTLTAYDRSGNSSVRFTGIVASRPSFSNMVATLKLRSDDRKLTRPFGRQITDDVFEDADQAALDELVPNAYGSMDSSGYNDKGMVKCAYVDTTLFRYLVCAGFVLVPNVYKNGTLVASGYAITHPNIHGRRYTLIDFTTDQTNGIITADVTGYDTLATGAGALIDNPVTALQHLLDNFVFGDYKRGAWLTGNAPVDATSWATSQTFCDDMGFEAAGHYGGTVQKSGMDAIAEFCEQFSLRCFWKGDGTIGLMPDDNRTTDIYLTTDYKVIQGHHFINAWDVTEDESNCINRVNARFAYSQSQGKFLQNLAVKDFEVDTEAPNRVDFTRVAAASASAPRPMVREAASRILRLYRLPWSMVTAELPMTFCQNEVMGDVSVSHWDAPWGNDSEDRRPFRIMWIEEEWTSRRVTLGLRDLTSYLVMAWDSCRALLTNSQTSGNGRARLIGGATLTSSRGTVAYVDTPQGDIAAVGVNDAKNDANGLLVETNDTNLILNSSFKTAGLTNWTKILAAAAVDDTGDTLFEDTTTFPQSCKLTAPTPVSTGDGIQQDVAGANIRYLLAVDHKDNSGQPLTWSLRRSVDSNWWRDSDGTWQATEQDNNFTVRTSTPARDWSSRYITPGAAPGNLRLRLRAKTAAGQINHIYHVQLTAERPMCSRIVTAGVAVSTNDDVLSVSDNTAHRTVYNSRGSARFNIRMRMSSDDIAVLPQTIVVFQHYFDASNYRMLFYDIITGFLTFRTRSGGVNYNATIAFTFSRDEDLYVGCRWVSSAGELGLAPYTGSVFARGIKGTDVVTVQPTQFSGQVYIASDSSSPGGVMIRGYEISQLALADEEFQKGLIF